MNDWQPFLDSTAVADDGPELLRRMQRDGYLFIRGLLPAEILESLRMDFLREARDGGWVRRDTPLEDAVPDQSGFCVEPEPEYMDTYRHMYELPQFHALQHRPELLGLLERMCGEPVMPHARIIGRTIFPQREQFTTPAHQDFIPIQGTPDTYTAWFPLHDLPSELGGLQISAGSHLGGVYEFRPALGAGGLEIVEPLEGTWVNSPFACGDVLFFHSLSAHRGLPNNGDALRMSIDARYQRISDPIDPSSLLPHIKPVTWEEIYTGWTTTEHQYYWRQTELEFSDYDSSYHEKRDQLAFEMAVAGDKRARSTLQRIAARDADVAKREKALVLLAELDSASRLDSASPLDSASS